MTLTVEAGTTVFATPVASMKTGAPSIVVEKGGTITASGTASSPITFTALDADTSSSGLLCHLNPGVAAAPRSLAHVFSPCGAAATVVSDTSVASGSAALGTRGKWGGLILLGKAPTNTPTTKEVEGITGKTYGGTDPADGSGTLRYVRVWHGGAVVGADNEINGITFGGVGSGTTVEYCEVAFNADDGFEARASGDPSRDL